MNAFVKIILSLPFRFGQVHNLRFSPKNPRSIRRSQRSLQTTLLARKIMQDITVYLPQEIDFGHLFRSLSHKRMETTFVLK